MIVKERMLEAGLNVTQYSGHSLRAGLTTRAAKSSVGGWRNDQQTSHRSNAMLSNYIQNSPLFSFEFFSYFSMYNQTQALVIFDWKYIKFLITTVDKKTKND